MKVDADATALVVLLISPLPPPSGGIARWTEQLLRSVRRESCIRLIHLDTATRWRPVHAVGLLTRMSGGLVQGARDAVRATILLLRYRPSIVHLCTSGSLGLLRDIVLMSMARIVGARVAIHVRVGRFATGLTASRTESAAFRLATWLADIVIVLDRSTEQSVRKNYRRQNVVRVPNFIDMSGMPPVHEREALSSQQNQTGRVRLLYVGWVIPAKGMRELVAAFAMLPRDSAELTIVGPSDCSFRRELEAKVAGFENVQCVSFVGELPHNEVIRQIQTCDVFVLPSYTEGFPNVLLEAMAYGKPVVSTSVGAIEELIGATDPQPAGIVVKPRDVVGLAAALSRITSDASFRLACGAAAQKRVDMNYSMERVVPQYVHLWRELAARGGSPRLRLHTGAGYSCKVLRKVGRALW